MRSHDTVAPRRFRSKIVAAAAIAVGLVVQGVIAGPALQASANVSLYCGLYDYRTASDKLPRPGIVAKTVYSFYTTYDLYTVNDDGGRSSIYISTAPYNTPFVSVWENGTDCGGSDISRNAWGVTARGQVYGDSAFSGPAANQYGDAANIPLNRPIVGMSATSTGSGYWLVASDGGIFTYGDAGFYGSTGNIRLNQPIAGISVTPSGRGYWMVASDGGIFTFGDANFFGSTGNIRLNQPITGMTATPSGGGYWMVASDGGVFTFGDAAFKGSTGGRALSAPIAGLIPHGSGYILIGQDGQTYPFY